jgi:hypothetical protein
MLHPHAGIAIKLVIYNIGALIDDIIININV